LLSGVAAVGGVLLANTAGYLLLENPTTLELAKIYSLQEYPEGLVVAAICGSAPELLLTQLRAKAEGYKKELAKSGPGAGPPAADSSQASSGA
jgi:hypothetical protein